MYDLENARTPKTVVQTVMKRVLNRWTAMTEASDVSVGSDVASEMLANTLDTAEEDVFCNGPAAVVAGSVSRIIDRLSLQQFYIRNTAFGYAIKPHVPGNVNPTTITPAQIKPGAMVRGNRPLAWITPTSTIEGVATAKGPSAKNTATRLRDHLGLDHFTTQYLLEMRYPLDALGGARVAAPTFVEGSCKDVYRSTVGSDGWGRAVDIGTINLAEGGPEAVHTPIKFTASFTLLQLGPVTSASPPSHDALHAACPRHWRTKDFTLLEKLML